MEGKEEGKGDRKIDRERIDKHPATGPQVFNLHPFEKPHTWRRSDKDTLPNPAAKPHSTTTATALAHTGNQSAGFTLVHSHKR